MAQQALGLIESRGMVALVEATDAALKAANVTYRGWKQVGSGLVTVVLEGDVAAVKAAVDAGAAGDHRRRRTHLLYPTAAHPHHSLHQPVDPGQRR